MSDDIETPAAETEALAKFQADCRQLLLRAYDGRGLAPGDDNVIRIGGVLDTDAAVDIEAVGDTPICYLRVNGEIVDTLILDLYRSAMQLASDLLSRISQHTERAPDHNGAGRYHA